MYGTLGSMAQFRFIYIRHLPGASVCASWRFTCADYSAYFAVSICQLNTHGAHVSASWLPIKYKEVC